MTERRSRAGPLATPALAEILLDQGLLAEARKMLDRLERERPGDERVQRLVKRLAEREIAGEPSQEPRKGNGCDAASLVAVGRDLEVLWELTEEGLELARRAARCSGSPVVRLLTVANGPRGVRKNIRDIVLQHRSGRLLLAGLPRPAIHVAAAGFLAKSGAFVPLATSAPTEGLEP